jgi:hypothetical protein
MLSNARQSSDPIGATTNGLPFFRVAIDFSFVSTGTSVFLEASLAFFFFLGVYITIIQHCYSKIYSFFTNRDDSQVGRKKLKDKMGQI